MNWWNTAVELFVVLAVMLALSTVWLLATRRQRLGGSHDNVAILSRLPIDARRSVVLIKVADEVIVTGVSDAGFQRLAAFPFAEFRRTGSATSTRE